MGFNLVFAPVLDLIEKPAELRSSRLGFGSDPSRVAACGEALVKGLRRHRVLACARHFPGLASVQPDAHYRMAVSAKPMAALWREDLLPFRQVLPHVPIVMMSTGAYKAYDFDVPRPAVFSSAAIEGLLRTKLAYSGVTVADLRQLEGEPSVNELARCAAKALQAGCDLIIVPSREDSFERIQREIAFSTESRRIPADRVEQALRRVQQCKKNLSPPIGQVRKGDVDRFMMKCDEFNREIQ